MATAGYYLSFSEVTGEFWNISPYFELELLLIVQEASWWNTLDLSTCKIVNFKIWIHTHNWLLIYNYFFRHLHVHWSCIDQVILILSCESDLSQIFNLNFVNAFNSCVVVAECCYLLLFEMTGTV